ncbi:MAG: FecR domain-containing protein [Synergistaceae bacterium]|nr:FecR domain-containing protein [Synergistaceae bacterium]
MQRCVTVLALLALLPLGALAAEPGGYVESVTPSMWAVRDNNRVLLEEGSEVYEFDIIQTSETGSGIIHFKDDSILEIGSDSEIDLRQVVFSSNRSRLNVGVMQGMARVISGGIIKINPRFMKLTTPRSSIGIRGTTVRIEETPEMETITGEDLEEGHFITVTNNRTFEVGSISGSGGSIQTGGDNSMSTSGMAQMGLPSSGRNEMSMSTPLSAIGSEGGSDGGGGSCRDSNTVEGNRRD